MLFCGDCRFEESVCVLVLVSRFVRCVLSLEVFCFLLFGFAEKGFCEEREGWVFFCLKL